MNKKIYVTCYSDQGCQSHASNKKIEPPEEGDPNHLLSAYQVAPLWLRPNLMHSEYLVTSFGVFDIKHQ